MKNIILASASPRRRELMDMAGIPFSVYPSEAEENITTTDPEKAVEELATLKCRDVFEKTTGDVLVIGADTVVAVNGEILGKPKDEQDAEKMLQMLQGNSHQVYTGVALMERSGKEERSQIFHEKTRVEFYPMTKQEIKDYIHTGEPMDKAGAYGIQGQALVFVKEIHGDYNNVVGLPMARLYQELKEMGVDAKEWKYV